jgi:hypothetical protein
MPPSGSKRLGRESKWNRMMHLSCPDKPVGRDAFDKKTAKAPDDDGAMIAALIDGAAEKKMNMELVAALAADAMTSSGKGGQRGCNIERTSSLKAQKEQGRSGKASHTVSLSLPSLPLF